MGGGGGGRVVGGGGGGCLKTVLGGVVRMEGDSVTTLKRGEVEREEGLAAAAGPVVSTKG